MKNNRYLLTLIIYGVAILLLMLVQVLVSLGCFNGLSEQMLEVVGSILPQVVIMFGIPLIILLVGQKIDKQPLSFKHVCHDVGWRRISFKNVVLCLCLGVLLYVLNIFVASIFATVLQYFGYQYTSSDNAFTGYQGLIITLILTAVLPAFCEEFLHRGVLLNGMIKKFGVSRAILLSSLLFGFMHMNAGQFFYAAILGWFMAFTTLSVGSLWGSIIVHFVNNALATYLSFAEELKLPGINLINCLFGNGVITLLVFVIGFIAIGEIMRCLARERFKRNLDAYTVRYLATQEKLTVDDFDRLKTVLPRALQTLPTWKATAAYIETFDKPQRAKPLEKALLLGIGMIGAALTVLSLIWGTW